MVLKLFVVVLLLCRNLSGFNEEDEERDIETGIGFLLERFVDIYLSSTCVPFFVQIYSPFDLFSIQQQNKTISNHIYIYLKF